MWLQLVSEEAFAAAVAGWWPNQRHVAVVNQVGVSLATGSFGREAVTACFLRRMGKRSPSGEYLEARQVLSQKVHLEDINRGASSQFPQKIPVRILLGGTDQAIKRAMRYIVDFSRTQSGRDAAVDDNGFWARWFHLRITELDYNRAKFYTVDEKRFAQLVELVARGLAIVDCRQPAFDASTAESAFATFRGLSTLLETDTLPGETRAQGYRGLENLLLNPDHLTTDMAPLLCSAIACSRSLRNVWVGVGGSAPNPKKLRYAMQWLGLALFSGLSRHSLQRVELDLELDGHEALQGLLDVLRASDPLTVVFGEDYADSIQQFAQMRATASRFALLDQTETDTEDCAIIVTEEHTGLRIVDHENDWWSVLLPPWGLAWVHDSDMSVTSEPNAHGDRVDGSLGNMPQVQSSGVDVSELERELTKIQALVSAIGTAGTRLQLDLRYVPARATDGTGLVSVVPVRQELGFHHVRAIDLGSLSDAFASLQVCRRASDAVEIRTKHVASGLFFFFAERMMRALENSPLSERFIRALEDPTHALYQCLESLYLETPRLAPNERRELCNRLSRVLEHNQRLVRLDVEVQIDRNDPADQALQDALLAHHATALAPRPLELREKLAFLSVLTDTDSVMSRAGVDTQQLDSAVVASIFQFGTRQPVRQVRVSFVP